MPGHYFSVLLSEGGWFCLFACLGLCVCLCFVLLLVFVCLGLGFFLTCTTRVINYILDTCDCLYAWGTYLNPDGNLPVEPIRFSEPVQVSSVGSYPCAHSFKVSNPGLSKALCYCFSSFFSSVSWFCNEIPVLLTVTSISLLPFCALVFT